MTSEGSCSLFELSFHEIRSRSRLKQSMPVPGMNVHRKSRLSRPRSNKKCNFSSKKNFSRNGPAYRSACCARFHFYAISPTAPRVDVMKKMFSATQNGAG